MRIPATVSLAALALAVLSLGMFAMTQHAQIRDLENRLKEVEESRVVQAKIVVTALDDTLGRPGEYFHFDPAPLDAAFGQDAWIGRQFAIILPQRGAYDQVRLWLRRGEIKIGFGRSETSQRSRRWQVGEVLMVLGVQDMRKRS